MSGRPTRASQPALPADQKEAVTPSPTPPPPAPAPGPIEPHSGLIDLLRLAGSAAVAPPPVPPVGSAAGPSPAVGLPPPPQAPVSAVPPPDMAAFLAQLQLLLQRPAPQVQSSFGPLAASPPPLRPSAPLPASIPRQRAAPPLLPFPSVPALPSFGPAPVPRELDLEELEADFFAAPDEDGDPQAPASMAPPRSRFVLQDCIRHILAGAASFAAYARAYDFRNQRNRHELTLIAAAIDALLARRSAHALDLLVRRFVGVQLADEHGDWHLAAAAMGDALRDAAVQHSVFLQWARESQWLTRHQSTLASASRSRGTPQRGGFGRGQRTWSRGSGPGARSSGSSASRGSARGQGRGARSNDGAAAQE